jgi:hypothetical protein
MLRKLTILSAFVFLFINQASATSGGCIDKVTPTSTTSAHYQHCQQFNGSVQCNAEKFCTWNVVQYYQNYCTGTGAGHGLAVDGQNCPRGTRPVPFSDGAAPNEKFKCCQRIEIPSVVKCCNPGGQVVDAMTHCTTRANPFQCCNPAGQPVAPMVAASNQCKKIPVPVGTKPIEKLKLRKARK